MIPISDFIKWRMLCTFVWLVKGIPSYFVRLFLADPSTVGGGHHIGKSLVVIAFLNWSLVVLTSGQIAGSWFWQLLVALSLYRAVIVQLNRDQSRGRSDPGQLHPCVMGVLELLPVANSWLTVKWQWRIWAPILLWLGSLVVAAACPLTARFLIFTAIVSYMLPGLFQTFAESRQRTRMESMIVSAERAMKPAPYVPVHGQRGAWLQTLQQQLRDQFDVPTVPSEHLNCPVCHVRLQADGIPDQALVTCSECEADFVVDRQQPAQLAAHSKN